MGWKYNAKTNRWEQSGGGATPPTTTQPTNEFEYKKGQGYVPVTTTTMPPTTTAAPTTTTPKAGTTPSTTTTVPTKGKTTTKPKTLRERFPKNPDGTTQFPGAKQNQPLDPKTLSDVVSELLGGGVSDSLLTAILGGGGSGEPSRAQQRKTNIRNARQANRQTTALANKYYGEQQTQANDAIRNATLEFLANIPQSTAYQQAPLVTVPPELHGLQQQLLSYGATGKDALTQQSQDAAAANMYQALARQGATQLGAAEQGYLDALRRAGQGGQTAGLAGVAGNIADLKNQLALSNLQALIQAQNS